MDQLKISGVVIKILNIETGVSTAGKDWKKQEFVIKTLDKYPSTVCFQVFGQKTDLLMKIREGQTVDVFFNAESRKYADRWFNSNNAWKIIITDEGYGMSESKSNVSAAEDEAENKADRLPF